MPSRCTASTATYIVLSAVIKIANAYPSCCSSGSCQDSVSYTDPVHNDDCKGWEPYACTEDDGLSTEQVNELRNNCPISCNSCDGVSVTDDGVGSSGSSSCQDDPNFVDSVFNDPCSGWASYSCHEGDGVDAALTAE